MVTGKLRNGNGVYTYYVGDMYAGEFRKNKMNGRGDYHFADSSSYVGMFKDDQFHGPGTWKTKELELRGNFENGLLEGKASINFRNGTQFTGTFASGVPLEGEVVYRDGSVYNGPLDENGQAEGVGRFTFDNGQFYLGNFSRKEGVNSNFRVLYSLHSQADSSVTAASCTCRTVNFCTRDYSKTEPSITEESFISTVLPRMSLLRGTRENSLVDSDMVASKQHFYTFCYPQISFDSGEGRYIVKDTIIYEGKFTKDQKHGNGIFM